MEKPKPPLKPAPETAPRAPISVIPLRAQLSQAHERSRLMAGEVRDRSVRRLTPTSQAAVKKQP